MRLFMMLFYLFLILLGVSFAALNANSVQINLYYKTITMPISVLMTIMLGIGLLLSFLIFLLRYWHLKLEFLKIKNQCKVMEKEIKNLRAIPLQDQR